MIQGDSPFRHNVPTILFEKILKEEPVFSDRFTPEAKDLITQLLVKDPEHRLGCGPEGIEEIKNHPFFSDMDWEGLMNKTVEVPRPPHRLEDVTDESHLTRAIAKMREAREEMMPDSPVSLPSSPSEQKHFDRFSYQGLEGWHPSMANMNFDEESGDFQPDTIAEDEEYLEEEYVDNGGDGDNIPLSPVSLAKQTSDASKGSENASPPSSMQKLSISPRTAHSLGSPGSPGSPVSPGSSDSSPATPTGPNTPGGAPQSPSDPLSPTTPLDNVAPSTPLEHPEPSTPMDEPEVASDGTPTPKSHFF
jgi:hypothetical protein